MALGGEPADRFLRLVRANDYVAVLAYLPSDDAVWESSLQAFRRDISKRTGIATTLGYGPRYLHSTGQLHKGGASNGVFVIITAEAEEDLPIPGEPYSFGVLETAQALGDFESLNRTGRRAMLVRLPRRDPATFAKLGGRLTSSCPAEAGPYDQTHYAMRATTAVTLSVAPRAIAERTTF